MSFLKEVNSIIGKNKWSITVNPHTEENWNGTAFNWLSNNVDNYTELLSKAEIDNIKTSDMILKLTIESNYTHNKDVFYASTENMLLKKVKLAFESPLFEHFDVDC